MAGSISVRRKVASKPVPRSASQYAVGMAGGALGALLGVGVFAPASWLAYGMEQASAGHVRLVNPVGRVWAGSAALELRSGAGGSAALTLPSRVSWALDGQATGLQLQLHADCCTAAPVRLRAGMAGVQVDAAQLSLPIAWLQGLGAPWNTLQLRGDMRAQWERMALPWSQPWQSLQAAVQVQLRGVSTRLTTLPEIGSYQLELAGGPTPTLKLSTLQGALQLTGQGQWHGRQLRFQGQAQAQPEQAAELSNLLTLLGRRQGNTTMMRWG